MRVGDREVFVAAFVFLRCGSRMDPEAEAGSAAGATAAGDGRGGGDGLGCGTGGPTAAVPAEGATGAAFVADE